VPLRSTVVLPFVDKAFGGDGEPADAMTEISLQILLEDLAWWARVLHDARAAGELAPGRIRARLAVAPS
jgi:hypothetical protein